MTNEIETITTDDYETVQGGALKLKGVSDTSGKKKKKKHKEKKKVKVLKDLIAEDMEEVEMTVTRPSKTKAEKEAFERRKRKKQQDTKSHKEKIMNLNYQLDNLTEHFDTPNVSWTK